MWRMCDMILDGPVLSAFVATDMNGSLDDVSG
jgi:hypothetical protein